MIYRRSPARAVRMLLRVAAPAGAVASIWACSSTPPIGSTGVHGFLVMPGGGVPSDDAGGSTAGEVSSSGGLIVFPPEDAAIGVYGLSSSGGSSGAGPYGLAIQGSSTSGGWCCDGADGSAYGLITDSGPAPTDTGSPDTGINGSVVMPPDGGGDDATGPCGGSVCGLIIEADGG